MASRHPPETAVVTEPVTIDEEFVSGLAFFRTIGDVTHLVFYADQVQAPEIGGAVEHRVRRRLVMPNDAVERMWRMLDARHAISPTIGTAAGDRHNSG